MSTTARLQALVTMLRRVSERIDRTGRRTEAIADEMAMAVGSLIVGRFPEQRSFVQEIDLYQLAKSVLKEPNRAADKSCRPWWTPRSGQ